MQAFGQPIKGTTRKVSASKFLGRDDLEERIKINEKKITLLKDIMKTQQMTTGIDDRITHSTVTSCWIRERDK